MMETLPRTTLSRAERIKRVARFKDLKGFDGGLPDSKMAGCERTLYNVIGFQPPKGAGGALTSPVGDQAAALAAIKISEGFNLGYCRAKPGRGPMMHNHRVCVSLCRRTFSERCRGATIHRIHRPHFVSHCFRLFPNVYCATADPALTSAARDGFGRGTHAEKADAGVLPEGARQGRRRALAVLGSEHAGLRSPRHCRRSP